MLGVTLGETEAEGVTLGVTLGVGLSLDAGVGLTGPKQFLIGSRMHSNLLA